MSGPRAPQGSSALESARGSRGSWGRRIVPLALDLVAVLVFAYLGRGAHEGGRSPGEVLEVALPFVVARLVVALLVREGATRVWPGGVLAWLVTWGAGMALRAALGGGTALPFVLVALGVLGAFFLGWRVVAWLLVRRRTR